MSAKTLASSVALTAALLCLPVVGYAQETHTITPHFPEHFKTRTTTTTDTSQDMKGQKTTSHTQGIVLAEIDKTATGYYARYSMESFDSSSLGPDGKPTAQDAQQKEMFKILMQVGKAEVTLDDTLTPVRVDNLDEIKAKAKEALTSTPELKADGIGEKLYNFMVAGQTPESAANLLRQGKQAGNFLNVPLTVGKPVAISGEPMQILGGSFNMNATITLQTYEEGKTAHLTYVMTPSSDDMHTFLAGMMKNMMGAMAPADATPEQVQMLNKMFDNIQMTMTLTCDVDYSLTNYIDTGTVCDTDTVMVMDMKKMLPPEMLGKDASEMPVLTIKQADHSVADRVLIP
jgi:hypothetical protein